jgi:Tfp pilus assembly protein PilF
VKCVISFLLLNFIGILCARCDQPQSQDYSEWQSPRAMALRESIEQDPEGAGAYYRQGYAASHIKDLATVHRSYQRAIELEPDNQWYQISYGWALFNAGAMEAAKAQWLRAYEFCEGKHQESQITVALGYFGTGEFEQAAVHFQKQVELDPNYAAFSTLQTATSHWTWREKEAVYQLFDIWRYSYR